MRPALTLVALPMGIAAALCAILSVVAGVAFLRTRRFQYDSISVAAVEVGLALLTGGLGVGMLADFTAVAHWWTWNAPLTSALSCGLLYAGYLILRHAVEEPTQRAVFSAVFSVFAFVDIPVVAYAVNAWCARRPQASLGSLEVPAAWLYALFFAFLAMALVTVRMRQEESRRELDSLRRTIHAF